MLVDLESSRSAVPAHLYLKRAKSSQLFLGDSDFRRQQLADRIGI